MGMRCFCAYDEAQIQRDQYRAGHKSHQRGRQGTMCCIFIRTREMEEKLESHALLVIITQNFKNFIIFKKQSKL